MHGVNHDCDSPSRLTSSRSFLLLIQFPEWLKADAVGKAGKGGKGESFGKGGKIAVNFYAICWFIEVYPIFGLYCIRDILYRFRGILYCFRGCFCVVS